MQNHLKLDSWATSEIFSQHLLNMRLDILKLIMSLALIKKENTCIHSSLSSRQHLKLSQQTILRSTSQRRLKNTPVVVVSQLELNGLSMINISGARPLLDHLRPSIVELAALIRGMVLPVAIYQWANYLEIRNHQEFLRVSTWPSLNAHRATKSVVRRRSSRSIP
jgi:hypothetical protein